MPRAGRLHIPGGCYHLIGRGLERRYIFEESADKKEFLARFGTSLQRNHAQCLAWVLMSNHYHFLIRAGSQPLAKLMAPVLGGYASYYNRRHNRSDYVFQNRYSSILCDENNYLLKLIRYIHLNPVRAKLLEDISTLASYPWTGHSGILGKHQQPWHSIDEVLVNFGKNRAAALTYYQEFIESDFSNNNRGRLTSGGLVRSHGGWESLSQYRREHIQCIGDERILGDSGFVERALKQDALAVEPKSKLEQQGWTLDKLIARICVISEVDKKHLLQRSRTNEGSRAKALICFWGIDALGLPLRQIGDRLRISPQAISKWAKKGRTIVELEYLTFDEFDA